MRKKAWKYIGVKDDESVYTRQENEREKEYISVNTKIKRVSYTYKYFVNKTPESFKAQQKEKDYKKKYSSKYGRWESDQAYIDIDTAEFILDLLK